MNIKSETHLLHAIVEGHVQGVGFRYFVKENAERMNLKGWVRNRYDGSVELTAEGDVDVLHRFIEIVRQGPSRSIVTKITMEYSLSTGLYSQFSFLPSE